MVGMDMNAAIALTRFGLGRRPDAPVPADPKRWLRDQLTAPDPTPTAGKPTSADGLRLAYQVQMQDKAAKAAGTPKEGGPPNPLQAQLHTEIHDFLGSALVTEAPFRERLVWFWANHFTIATRARPVTACAGAYIREAIRPHVTGRFSDMLLAVMRHPAMLAYLDQARSAGPDSLVGERRHLGLNENLARECLELHTVSPASGYTQADVTAFARVLTGWSFEWREPVGFRFRPGIHEPGEQTVMGRTWPAGEAGGIALLAWLADHPSTHRHLAEKLVRHFVADDPPPAQVQTIEAVLRDTRGDLCAASAALIDLPGAWTPLTKLRSPQEYVIACLRGLNLQPDAVPNLAGMVAGLGQPVFGAPFPIGWPDRAADWANPEALLQRVDYAYGLSGRATGIDPVAHAGQLMGPLLNADTMSAMKGAGSRRDAMTLLIASPEFQRR
jgi:uncharacterized protein (DUF1800 family)